MLEQEFGILSMKVLKPTPPKTAISDTATAAPPFEQS